MVQADRIGHCFVGASAGDAVSLWPHGAAVHAGEAVDDRRRLRPPGHGMPRVPKTGQSLANAHFDPAVMKPQDILVLLWLGAHAREPWKYADVAA
ncbi:MAG: hypothetical protein WCJ30_07420, partial [Deltaproteobacteria bacterium]